MNTSQDSNWMNSNMKTTCPYCGVGCGVEIHDDIHNGIEVKGDSEHPANRGRLCSKGSALADTLDDKGRLLYPEINGSRVSWEQATDYIATELQQTISQYGRDSVAFYASGQILTEDYYVINKLVKGWLGTANIDTNSRLCMASTVVGHKRAFGTDTVPGNYADLEAADLIVIVGSNMAWCHPVLYQRIMAEKERRPELYLVVVDPRRTATADSADLHLPILPDGDTALFNGLLAYLAAHDALDHDYIQSHVNGLEETLQNVQHFEVDQVAQRAGVDAAMIDAFYQRVLATQKTVTIFSQGVNQSASGTDKVNAIINCHLATGRIGKLGMGPFSVTGQPNAMGGREVGGLATMLASHMELNNPEHRQTVQQFWNSPYIADAPGLCAVDLFQAVADGKIKAIWIIGTNPVDSMPEADSIRSALQSCPLVIVSDVMQSTDTIACAHVRLPAHAWGEKDGTVTNSERCISRQRRIKVPVGEARADWWAASQVASKMGYGNAFSYQCPADIFREHAELSGINNAGQRDFDISAGATISNSEYETLHPFYWPWSAGVAPTQPMRFFAKGSFFTANKRGNMLVVDSVHARKSHSTDHYPLYLNTGRNRDQWHTMTRTGYSVRLSQHLAEPYLAIHPQDAATHGINAADLVQVDSTQANVLLRALITDRQQPGQVYAPMHWTDQFASKARVDSLVCANVDPYSKQPASKNQPVAIKRHAARSYAFGVLRQQPEFAHLPEIEYWAIAPVTGGWQFEAASNLTVNELSELLTDMGKQNNAATDQAHQEMLTLADDKADLASIAIFHELTLHSLLFVAGEPVQVSRTWAHQQLASPVESRSRRWQVLTGRAGADQPDKGAIVCSCFSVGKSEIERAISKLGCADVNSVGKFLKAGTNCGSCRNEIQSIITQTAVLSSPICSTNWPTHPMERMETTLEHPQRAQRESVVTAGK